MSDIAFSGSDSEPVSEVNAEEMAKLMADLDGMDDGLSKSKPKRPTAQKDDKDINQQVTFEKAKIKESTAAAADDDDDDWDADDLLQSDDEACKSSQKKKTSASSGTAAPAKTASPLNKSTDNENFPNKSNTKSKLMADLFNDESTNKEASKRSTSAPSEASQRDKSKLMSDLFGGEGSNDDSSPKKSSIAKTPSSSAPPNRAAAARKTKDEVTFDDDDDIFSDIGDSKKKSKPVSGSPKSSGFMDSLLGKNTTSTKKEKFPEFVLDDKYKNMGKEKKEDNYLDGYMPSSGKSSSPEKKLHRKGGSADPLDFLNDLEPRRRNPRSAAQRKTFEIDDDDILGNIRSRRGPGKGDKNQSQTKGPFSKSPSKSSKSRGDDWLFGNSDNSDVAAKKLMDEASIAASVDQGNVDSKTDAPNKSQDWLGSLLSSDKKPQSSSSTSPNIKSTSSPQAKASPNKSLVDNNLSGISIRKQTTLDGSPVTSAPLDNKMIKLQTSDTYQKEISMQHQLSEAENSQSIMQVKIQQEKLLQQQQEAKMNAISQMKAQQEQLEAQMAQQLLHQQEELAKLQDASMKRYQEAMASSVVGFGFNPPPLENKSDETLKELQIQLKSAEVDVARLTAELELVRQHHKEEVAILEESYRKRQEMEREVWERTEQRLKEERDSLLSDFQVKIKSLQADKEALAASHEVQLVSVKNEWSQVVDRTKQLYAEMAERMKEEHSAALERMRYLKDLELNAAVSASSHVKEVEAVMVQLESNTANLSDLTSSINARQDTALEITQRALKLKEQQLKEFEAQIEATRAEAESERGRLHALVSRLESTLIQQGTEVEKEKWRLTQEQMKTEMERKALIEERRHMQISAQNERQNLASARESLLSEHKMMLQSVAQEKQELATQRAHHLAQEKISQVPSFSNTAKNRQLEMDAEMKLLNNERCRLREKMTELSCQERFLEEEERKLDQLKSEMEQQKVKIVIEKDYVEQEKSSFKKMQAEMDCLRQSSEGIRREQQSRLSQIAMQIQALHTQQEKLEREQLKLDQKRMDIISIVQQGLCPSCQALGLSKSILDSSTQLNCGRLPGDGGEGHNNFKYEASHGGDMSPASVYARLIAARKQEKTEREKRQLKISALESS